MNQYPGSKEEFERLVRERMKDRGEPFIIALYRVLDECVAHKLQETGTVLACCRRCSLCCHQLVTITQLEWQVIERYLRPRAKEAKDAARNARRLWQPYWEANKFRLTHESHPLGVLDDWMGKAPCVFLNKYGECTIYSVRPIDCRTYTSTIRCQEGVPSNVVRFRFDCEEWANNLVIEEGMKIDGRAAATPLPHLVLVEFS